MPSWAGGSCWPRAAAPSWSHPSSNLQRPACDGASLLAGAACCTAPPDEQLLRSPSSPTAAFLEPHPLAEVKQPEPGKTSMANLFKRPVETSYAKMLQQVRVLTTARLLCLRSSALAVSPRRLPFPLTLAPCLNVNCACWPVPGMQGADKAEPLSLEDELLNHIGPQNKVVMKLPGRLNSVIGFAQYARTRLAAALARCDAVCAET